MAAATGTSISRFSDPRLFGAALTHPFREIYASWIKPVANPIHPASYKACEFGRRALNALAGIIFVLAFSFVYLLGQIAQMIHYYIKSDQEREKPRAIQFEGMSLPQLKFAPSDIPSDLTYKQGVINTLSANDNGPQPVSSATGLPLQRAILPHQFEIDLRKQTAEEAQTALRGSEFYDGQRDALKTSQIVAKVSEDVMMREVAIVDLSYDQMLVNLHAAWNNKRLNSNDPRFKSAVNELFRLNGYKFIQCQAEPSCFIHVDVLGLDYLSVRIGEKQSFGGIPTN